MMNTIEEWPEPGVGADDLEQVGEAGDRGALVRRHAGLAPGVGERAAVATLDVLGDGLLGGVEAGGHDDRVDLAGGAVGGDDAGRGDLADPVGDQVDVVGVERGVVVVGDQDALAADLEVRRHGLAQLGVGDAALDVLQRQLLRRGGQLRVDREARARSTRGPSRCRCGRPSARTAGGGTRTARSPCSHGRCAASPTAPCAGRRRGGRPASATCGDDLDRRGAGADDRDALAGQVVVVVPAGGVEDLAGEGVDARDLGQLGLREPAGAGDQRRRR